MKVAGLHSLINSPPFATQNSICNNCYGLKITCLQRTTTWSMATAYSQIVEREFQNVSFDRVRVKGTILTSYCSFSIQL